jgi:hypothetical protein
VVFDPLLRAERRVAGVLRHRGHGAVLGVGLHSSGRRGARVADRSVQPSIWRHPGRPGARDAAAFLAEYVTVVPELGLECQLVPGVVYSLVDPVAPDHERTQRLDVGGVFPPAVLEVLQCLRLATV